MLPDVFLDLREANSLRSKVFASRKFTKGVAVARQRRGSVASPVPCGLPCCHCCGISPYALTLQKAKKLLSGMFSFFNKSYLHQFQNVKAHRLYIHGKRRLYKLFVNLVISVLPLILYIKM